MKIALLFTKRDEMAESYHEDWEGRDGGWAMCSKKGEKVYTDGTCEKHQLRRRRIRKSGSVSNAGTHGDRNMLKENRETARCANPKSLCRKAWIVETKVTRNKMNDRSK